MARPKKTGLDYFPVDTVFDEKIQILESKFGNDGVTWILKFWQMAYKTEKGEVNMELFGELLANQSRITVEKQVEMLNLSEKINLLYKTGEGLWTSNGIKKRISVVSHERKTAIQRQEERKLKEKESKGKETPHCSANNNSHSLKPKTEYSEEFLSFWNEYPKLRLSKFGYPKDKPKGNQNTEDEDEDETEMIYSLYPAKDVNNNNRSTGKCNKNKDKIRAILKEDTYPLLEGVKKYITQCQQTKSFLLNLGTFLNNLPDISALDSKPEQIKKQPSQADIEHDKMMAGLLNLPEAQNANS